METSATSLKTTLELQELKSRYASLSERQRDTMHLLIRGSTTRRSAWTRHQPADGRNSPTWVMTRMQAKSMAELVRLGLALGLA